MKKKITVSTALTLVVLTAALAVSVTMMLAMRYFNRQVQWVSQRKAMYTYIDETDQAVREHYATLNEETLRQNVIAGFVAGTGDAYAQYFTPQAYLDEQQRLSGYANNVGISLCADASGNIVIYDVAPDSAAAKAGVQKGDVLTAVDGVEVADKTALELQRTIDAAEKVLISVRRADTNVAFELSPYRYVVRSARSSTIGTVGYIKITAF
ncbi:MAG: PDZ domain-containing protein, partial [Clostridia bacterium]|nr:PDZ domain-containing protein [Clostridia bacterium]